MSTPIKNAITEISGYKKLNKTIDVDFVVAVLKTFIEEEKAIITNAYLDGDQSNCCDYDTALDYYNHILND